MSKLRTLSGYEVLRILRRFGFRQVSQQGSHVKMRRVLPNGVRESLTVPLHSELDRGTLHAIYRKAARFVPESDLWPHFHSD
jgi:predicted RNA binding protein YcfA (HicA-like mRNA interferase family)